MVFQNNRSNLPDLIWLCLTASPLQVDLFLDAFFPIEMMAPAYSFVETQASKHASEIVKRNIRV